MKVVVSSALCAYVPDAEDLGVWDSSRLDVGTKQLCPLGNFRGLC